MNYIAVSLCGHDKDKAYVILYKKDGYAYLADGKTKGLVNLKKKKLLCKQTEKQDKSEGKGAGNQGRNTK